MSEDNPITVEMVGIKNEREELLIKLWWNEAIEAAILKLEDMNFSKYSIGEIRKLKK
jgi:hypothetical protein